MAVSTAFAVLYKLVIDILTVIKLANECNNLVFAIFNHFNSSTLGEICWHFLTPHIDLVQQFYVCYFNHVASIICALIILFLLLFLVLQLYHLNGGGRWLMTGSLDRMIKVWDMENPAIPVCSTKKKHILMDGVWLNHWLSSIVTFDDTTVPGTLVLYMICSFHLGQNENVLSL